jgi:hypothetical protein
MVDSPPPAFQPVSYFPLRDNLGDELPVVELRVLEASRSFGMGFYQQVVRIFPLALPSCPIEQALQAGVFQPANGLVGREQLATVILYSSFD